MIFAVLCSLLALAYSKGIHLSGNLFYITTLGKKHGEINGKEYCRQFHVGYEIAASCNFFKSHGVPALRSPVN